MGARAAAVKRPIGKRAAGVGRRTGAASSARNVQRVGLQPGAGSSSFRPPAAAAAPPLPSASLPGDSIEQAPGVALEVPRIDLGSANRAGGLTDDCPVVSRAAAIRSPTVVHSATGARRDQVLTRVEEHVAGCDDNASVLHAARSISPPRPWIWAQSGRTSPCTRSLATPPSG